MPDATGLKGMLMTVGEKFGPSKKKDINLPLESKKKKQGFLDRFVSTKDKDTQGAINRMRDLATKK